MSSDNFVIEFKKSRKPLWIEKIKSQILKKRAINTPDLQREKIYEKKGKKNLKNLWDKQLYKKLNDENIINFFCATYRNEEKLKIFFKKYKTVYIFDSYFTFAIGHFAILWDSAQRLKKEKSAGMILVFNKWMHCGLYFNKILKNFLGKQLILVECKKCFNWKSLLEQACSNKKLVKIKTDSLCLENPAWEKKVYLQHKKKAFQKTEITQAAKAWLASKCQTKKTNDHVIFHLRTPEFRGWNSVRDGRELHTYQEYFSFLKSCGLTVVVFGPLTTIQIDDALVISSFEDVTENIQLGLIHSALMVVGNLSGITHLGPAFCIPTITFDVPAAINFGNPNFNKILFRPVVDQGGRNIPNDIYFKYEKAISCDVEGELKIQKAGYRLKRCTNDDLSRATIHSLRQISLFFPQKSWEVKASLKALKRIPKIQYDQINSDFNPFISRTCKLKTIGRKYFYVPLKKQVFT